MSFAEAAAQEAKATAVTVAENTAALAVAQANIIANPNADVTGEWERRELKIPDIAIAQKVGGLSEQFPFCSVILNKEYQLSDGKNPVTLTVLRIDKSYEEIVEYGSDIRPQTASTLAEVHRKGGTIAKSEDAAGNEVSATWRPVAKALLCIHGGDKDIGSPHFPYEFNGKPYAFALWTMRSVAFSRAATFIRTAADFAYRAGLTTGTFKLTVKSEKFNQNSFAAPVLAFGEKNSPEFRQWLSQFNLA